MVSIPHVGLRTSMDNYVYVEVWESPSHTVGLEPEAVLGLLASYFSSPSHTVGLERIFGSQPFIIDMCDVSIPHGGLRTRM